METRGAIKMSQTATHAAVQSSLYHTFVLVAVPGEVTVQEGILPTIWVVSINSLIAREIVMANGSHSNDEAENEI